LEALQDGHLSLPYVAPLVKRFEQLCALLVDLKEKKGATLLDSLLPAEKPWAAELRGFAPTTDLDDLDAPALLDRLSTQITQPEIPEAGQFARVMSLHKSKGLTSKVVIVTGCMQGLIPNRRKEGTPPEREAYEREQRRLFYVALTRCTDVLVLSSAYRLESRLAHEMNVEVGSMRGNFVFPIASSFLKELGPNVPRSQRGTDWLRVLVGW
jgi:DNA helicase II / ATP-dependent DNA helicase PcrA